mmetsp:Transcript_5975/g.13155  ORF Transcript_5975/g.13155 Transcript_5975/m.13155 type:complete len:96 (+) Transcript_5975:67-354(+)
MGVFETHFNRPGALRAAHKRNGLVWVWAVFSLPTFLVLIGNHPDVQKWFVRIYRPVEYPPQADPTIVSDIFHGRQPRSSSMESYEKEARRFESNT